MKITRRQLRKLINEMRIDTKNPLDFVPDGPMKDNVMDLINDPDKDVQRQGYELASLMQEPIELDAGGGQKYEDIGYEGEDYLKDLRAGLLNREQVISILDNLFDKNKDFEVLSFREGAAPSGKFSGQYREVLSDDFSNRAERINISVGSPGNKPDYETGEFRSGKSLTWINIEQGLYYDFVAAIRVSDHDDDSKGHKLRDVISAYMLAVNIVSKHLK
tara:strand:+ start:633 stop:1286 length:654 start_codon:yes stop_codon:yes gene_type:complete